MAHFSLSKRAELFFRIYQLVDEHREDLARLLTAEHGKGLSDALGEVQRGIEVIEYVCGIPSPEGRLLRAGLDGDRRLLDPPAARRRRGDHALQLPGDGAHVDVGARDRMREHVRPEAVGEGPVRLAPLTAELLKEAGLPDGVFNVVQGDKVAVDRPARAPRHRGVSFVGSTPIARYVYETGTKAGKRMQALGGAKNHMVVLPDADIDMAADAAVSAGYGSAGERCMAVGRRRGRRRGRRARRRDQGAAPQGQGRGRPRPLVGDGAARHARAPRQGRVVSRLGSGAG